MSSLKDADRMNEIYDAQMEIMRLRPRYKRAKDNDNWALRWELRDKIWELESIVEEHKKSLNRAPVVHKTYAPMFSSPLSRSGRVRPKGKSYR